MKKHLTAWLIVTCAIGLAFFGNPPDGRTGAPGEQSCDSAGCHRSSGASHTANVAISGFPTVLNGGETYTINLTASHGGTIPSNPRLGFQLVVLDENNTNIGTLSNPTPQATLVSSGGRTYAEHNPGQTSSNTTWTVDFTAPAASSSQEVTVYATVNVANGNGSTSGDIIREVTMNGALEATADPLVVRINKLNDCSCNGVNDGSAEVITTGGPTGDYTYAWDNGEATAVATQLSPGLHTVTVSDQSEIAVESITINQPDSLLASFSERQDPSCHDIRNGRLRATAEGGTAPYTYLWNTGANGNELRNVFGGVYTVSITDANNCTTTITDSLVTPAPIELNFESVAPLCYDSMDGIIRIEATGGTGDISFEWQNDSTTDQLSNVGAGTYRVMATDDNGCLAEDSVELIAPDPIQISLEAEELLCSGDTLSGIEANVMGGTGRLSLSWSTGSDSLSSGPVTAGRYSLTITDENNCLTSDSIEITEPAPLNNITDSLSPFCPNDSTGLIELNPFGGTPPYSFNWSHTQADTNFLANLGGGLYRFTITDSLGCNFVDSVLFDIPAPIQYNLEINNETALNTNDGTASLLNITGGYPPYSFLWSTGDTATTVSNLAPGMYSLTIIDSNGCEVMDIFNVEAFECILALDYEATDPLCVNTCDGRIELNLDGERMPVDIQSPVALDGLAADSLCADSYPFMVEDASGCKDSIVVVLMEPPAIFLQIDSITDANGGPGAIYLSAMGGTGTLQSELLDSDGNIIAQGNADLDFTEVAAGDYRVLVYDDNGCSAMSIDITVELIQNNAENSDFNLTFYPNPVDQLLHVHTSRKGRFTLKLYHLSSARLWEKVSMIGSDKTIDVSELPEGVYLLEIQNEKGVTEINKILKL